MSELFERLAEKVGEERAERIVELKVQQRVQQIKIDTIKNIMDYFKCSLEEALDALEITGKEALKIQKIICDIYKNNKTNTNILYKVTIPCVQKLIKLR